MARRRRHKSQNPVRLAIRALERSGELQQWEVEALYRLAWKGGTVEASSPLAPAMRKMVLFLKEPTSLALH